MKNISEVIARSAAINPAKIALISGPDRLSYAELHQQILQVASCFKALSLEPDDRMAVLLDKQSKVVSTLFGAMAIGAISIPINPLLKPRQITRILLDSGAKILVTTRIRYNQMRSELSKIKTLRRVVILGSETDAFSKEKCHPTVISWPEFSSLYHPEFTGGLSQKTDSAMIFYTSGSTGPAKGVLCSHGNLIAGARAVSGYLENSENDRILCLLPLSFDAGFSQLTTGFLSGATVVLMNYLLPDHVPAMCAREKITGITGVPPLWHALLSTKWPTESTKHLRYFANTGGHLDVQAVAALRDTFNRATPYLMYGLTEAFRSTYLSPDQIDHRPGSMGKAIPEAHVLVLRPDCSVCDDGETGELVHYGPTVSKGYWNAPDLTADKFKPIPGDLVGSQSDGVIAVWSGDQVRRDAEGFLYFIGRMDDMIKTSGYRVSPTEIEEVLCAVESVREVVVLGLPDSALGQSIAAVIVADEATSPKEEILTHCRKNLPAYMVPERIFYHKNLPKNPNGKYARKEIKEQILSSGVVVC